MIELTKPVLIYHHRTNLLLSSLLVTLYRAFAYLVGVEETSHHRRRRREGKVLEKEETEGGSERTKEEVGSHASRLALFLPSEVFP